MIGLSVKRAMRIGASLSLFLFFATAASAHPSWGIVADPQGRVYFSDLEQVWRIDPDGRLSLFRPSVGAHVHELALASNGDVLGVQNAYDPSREEFSSGVWRRTPGGAESWPVPMATVAPRGSGPWRDRSGNSYVTQWVSNDDPRLMLFRRTPGGKVDLLFGEPAAAARLRNDTAYDVAGLALGPDGSVLFADRGLIRRVVPGGEARIVYDGGPGAGIRGLAIAPDGTILAADLASHRLVSIAPDGKASILYRGSPGWGPTGVALTRGRMLVLEAEEDPSHRSNRVRVVEVKDGRAHIIAAPGEPTPPAARPADARARGVGSAAFGALLVAVAAAIGSALGFARWSASRKRGRTGPC